MDTKYINYSWAEYTKYENVLFEYYNCLLYTSPSPRDCS